ncbi:hypothetical protein ACS0TY_026405 [Phlomoides rotata]
MNERPFALEAIANDSTRTGEAITYLKWRQHEMEQAARHATIYMPGLVSKRESERTWKGRWVVLRTGLSL